jgi:5-formyltetrahydrofolate cyclo-ligase
LTESNRADSETARIKQALRINMRALRDRLQPDEVRQAAQDVVPALQSLLQDHYPDIRSTPLQIAVYAAFRNELDLAEAWPKLLHYPARLYFPSVVHDHLELGALPEGMMPQDWLVPGCLGILEPPPGSHHAILPFLDLILLPGIAFDRHGNRIGWGKAYYDGLLAGLPAETIRVGVGYDFQILPELPSAEHDQKLDVLLTPSGWCRCA